MTTNTLTIIRALQETNNVDFDGSIEEVATFLAGWHRENLELDGEYHAVLAFVDLEQVNWRVVAANVISRGSVRFDAAHVA